MGFLYQLPWQSADGGYGNVAKAIISDWQVNGVLGIFSGAPFTLVANGAAVNTPSNQQTPDLIGTSTSPATSARAARTTTLPRSRRRRASDSATRAAAQFRGPGGHNLDLSIFRAFPLGATRRLEVRAEGVQPDEYADVRQSGHDITTTNFMRITALQSGYSERQVRLGLRFAF